MGAKEIELISKNRCSRQRLILESKDENRALQNRQTQGGALVFAPKLIRFKNNTLQFMHGVYCNIYATYTWKYKKR